MDNQHSQPSVDPDPVWRTISIPDTRQPIRLRYGSGEIEMPASTPPEALAQLAAALNAIPRRASSAERPRSAVIVGRFAANDEIEVEVGLTPAGMSVTATREGKVLTTLLWDHHTAQALASSIWNASAGALAPSRPVRHAVIGMDGMERFTQPGGRPRTAETKEEAAARRATPAGEQG